MCITIGLLGHGENRATGDFSRGAQGVWIENGQLTSPVAEITSSGKLQDTDMIGNNLVWRGHQAAPTVRMRKRVVSGT